VRQQPFAWYAASLKTSPASEFHNATVSDEHNRHLKQVDISEASSERLSSLRATAIRIPNATVTNPE